VSTYRSSAKFPEAMACVVLVIVLSAVVIGCAARDPAADFIARTDRMPPEKQPPNWSTVKQLMARRAPQVGEPAPDFTLPTLDGREITRSAFQLDRPLVLVFGSFT